ncbi:MAG TPA: hypothetical protein VGA75_13845 [Paracoccaceae bacterium]
MSPRNKLIVAALVAGTLSGCADYLNRRDSVTLGAGNAAEANTAIQTINPWPPAVNDVRIVNGSAVGGTGVAAGY